MRVFDQSAASIREVVELIGSGEVVALPTETVYGLAADALNSEAVAKIFEIKGRPSSNPLIIHVASISIAQKFGHFTPLALRLAEAFWPGPLTIVVDKAKCIPDSVTAGLRTVGIRCPKHPQMLEVLQKLGRPVAAPSANPSNYISPTTAEHVRQGLGARLSYVLDGGACNQGVESTIVRIVSEAEVELLRVGPITASQIKAAGGDVRVVGKLDNSQPNILTSPGQMKKHYSPKTKLYLHPPPRNAKTPFAHIHFAKEAGYLELPGDHFFFSDSNHSGQAEQRLYQILQTIDRACYKAIYTDPIPEGEAWLAIKDRLNRASA